ncbi:hypothetical protein P8452_37976 [Trifolium repens]|nr:hypothetical protein P8452_37976 [Trifolium repens]
MIYGKYIQTYNLFNLHSRLLSMVSVICLSPKSKLPLQQDLSVLVLISERNYTVFQLFEGELSFELGIDFCRDDFRKTLKEVNYDSKDGKRVSKEIGEKWWSMTDAEKKPYLDRVIELKAEYEKPMEIYNATKKKDQQEGYDKSNKEATAVPTRQEIVTLQGSELLPYFFRILIYMFSLPIL